MAQSAQGSNPGRTVVSERDTRVARCRFARCRFCRRNTFGSTTSRPAPQAKRSRHFHLFASRTRRNGSPGRAAAAHARVKELCQCHRAPCRMLCLTSRSERSPTRGRCIEPKCSRVVCCQDWSGRCVRAVSNPLPSAGTCEESVLSQYTETCDPAFSFPLSWLQAGCKRSHESAYTCNCGMETRMTHESAYQNNNNNNTNLQLHFGVPDNVCVGTRKSGAQLFLGRCRKNLGE